ncbi:kinase-like protein [Anaeromyces robustus]|uniref:non-specific serine/threonine protein kinase n=1 Tax=Anaeromyces robustus TaxID=1754192 RepID=A0A1Y1XIK9_9FUNG|nr:kinase-like protein [Anaeromyces robustus]|eukprot:ORX85599.1 kinase-like protein [Anaeromyces robustus]
MSEKSAWETFSLIKKQEEDKLNSLNYNYNDSSSLLNDIHVYDTDTTDSEDYEYYRKEIKKDLYNKSTIDTNFISPPKSSDDSANFSPIETLATVDSNINKYNFISFTASNTSDKETVLKHKLLYNKKEKRKVLESAWTKFIKDNPAATSKYRDRENDMNFSYLNKIYKNADDDNLESLEILENLSVNSLNSLTSVTSLNSTGSRKNNLSTIEDYSFFTNSNKNDILKAKDLSKSSMELLNSDNRSHSYVQKTFLESDISAWRNRPIKEIESTESSEISTLDSKSNLNRPTFDFDINYSDSISAWKIDSSKSIKEILKGYNIKQAIGKGYCGTIFKGINEKTGQPIAVKAEKITEKNKHLEEEYGIYQRLFGLEGMPRVLYYGNLEKNNIMIMELLGPSIESLFRLCQRNFTMKTICMIAKQLITRLEKVHERGIVYRDIKPENFLIGYIDYSKPITNQYKKGEEVYLSDGTVGRPPVATVYLADFGLSEFYKNPVTNTYVPNKKKPPCGTPRYMSLNTHRCDQQTPRDDLEALCYCLMYFCFRGRLPWMGITAKTPEAMIMSIGRTKSSISVEQLCKSLPKPFSDYLNYVRHLGFYDKPDYDYLRDLFDKILSDMGTEDDGNFDWIALIRLHQEQKAKKQKMEREKEMKRYQMEKIKMENHEKKRKLSVSQENYSNSINGYIERNGNNSCKKHTISFNNENHINNGDRIKREFIPLEFDSDITGIYLSSISPISSSIPIPNSNSHFVYGHNETNNHFQKIIHNNNVSNYNDDIKNNNIINNENRCKTIEYNHEINYYNNPIVITKLNNLYPTSISHKRKLISATDTFIPKRISYSK